MCTTNAEHSFYPKVTNAIADSAQYKKEFDATFVTLSLRISKNLFDSIFNKQRFPNLFKQAHLAWACKHLISVHCRDHL